MGGVLPKLGGGGFARNPLLPYAYFPYFPYPFPCTLSANKDETQLHVTFFQLMRVCVPCDYVRASFFQRFTHGGLALQHILHDQLWVTQLWKDSISCLVTACGL